ncbi:MAG: cache domain-containing protein, partial [Campylobacterota bacterium]|nr:cache domain-containing protein [Campylobacterota bacterium]
MNLFSEKNIPKLIILTPIITAVLIAFFVINFFIQTQNDYFEKESYRLEDIFLTNQKKLLEKELNKVIHYIEHHVKNSANLSEAELKKQLIQYIETIRYGQDGYIWIHDTTYFLIAHPFRPDSINTYDIDLQDAMDTFITKKFVDETIKHPKGTFIEYYWQKPKDVHFSPKLGFFKLYEKYNWVIGTGLYITDIEKSIYQSKKLLEKRIDDYIQVVVSISAFIIFIFGILSYMISNKINKVLTQYRQNVKRKELLLEDLNKNLERKVQIAIKEIQDKDKAMIHQSRLAIMGSMLSMIAHQWRQPLSKVSAILMELETATKFGKSNDAMLIQSIEESNKHLSYMSYTIDDFKN